MNLFNLGDMVVASRDLYNDPLEETGESGIPGIEPNHLLAAVGTRGVVVNIGHAEADPKQGIYLVRFETSPGGELADPIGCLREEICYRNIPIT
jgi:nitrogen fixation protein NifZ